MRAGEGLRRVEEPLRLIVLSRKRLLASSLAFPHREADLERFLQALKPLLDRWEWDAEAAALGFVPGRPDAEPGAAAGEHVERGHGLCQDARVAIDRAGHHGAQLHARGDPSHVAEGAVALEHVVVFGAVHADLPEVIHHPDGLEAGLVGRGGDRFDGVAELDRPARPGEVREAEPDLHQPYHAAEPHPAGALRSTFFPCGSVEGSVGSPPRPSPASGGEWVR